MPAMTIHAFTGDGSACFSNRLPNEILFTACGDSGEPFNAIQPGATRVQLLHPAGRELAVTDVIRDGSAFHARLARYSDEPAVRAGLYLVSLWTVVSIPFGETYVGATLASVKLDEDLPAIERPQNPTEDSGA